MNQFNYIINSININQVNYIILYTHQLLIKLWKYGLNYLLNNYINQLIKNKC